MARRPHIHFQLLNKFSQEVPYVDVCMHLSPVFLHLLCEENNFFFFSLFLHVIQYVHRFTAHITSTVNVLQNLFSLRGFFFLFISWLCPVWFDYIIFFSLFLPGRCNFSVSSYPRSHLIWMCCCDHIALGKYFPKWVISHWHQGCVCVCVGAIGKQTLCCKWISKCLSHIKYLKP